MMHAAAMALLVSLLPLQQSDSINDLHHVKPEVRIAACNALGHKGATTAIAPLIELLKDEKEEPVRAAAVDALERLTGRKGNGPDYARWKEWWEAEGRRSFPMTQITPEQVNDIIRPVLDRVEIRADKGRMEIHVLLIITTIIAVAFVLVMIYFVGHVSSKLKEWKDLVRQAGAYIEQSQQITKRTDRVLEELEAKKGEIFEFIKNLKEEKEAEIERYNDLLQENTEHRLREEVMGLRQKAEKELEETLAQLKQQIDLEVRRLGSDQKEKIDASFKVQHERFMKEVETHTLFLQASFDQSHGKAEDALRSYKRLVAVKPDHKVAWERMGSTYRDLARYDEAIEAYLKAIELDPDSAAGHYNLAATYARLRRRDRMIEELALAVKNDGEFKDEALNDPAFRDYWHDPAFKDLAEA